MMLKRSLNKFCPPSNFFLFTLKKQTPLTLLVTAFSLLVCPGVLLNEISTRLEYSRSVNMQDYFVGFSLAIFIISLALMVLLTTVNLNFLNSKKAGDVFHALPLTRNQLIFLRVIPSFIGAAFAMVICFASLAIINFMPHIDGVDTATVIMTFFAMLVMLFLSTLYTSVFAVLSGTVVDFIIAIGAVTAAIPIIYTIGINWLDNMAVGVVWNDNYLAYRYTSPFIFAGVTVAQLADNYATPIRENFWKVGSEFNFITVTITLILIAVLGLLISKLFKVRKSETAGEAYSFRFVPHIISFLVSVVGGYLLAYIFTGRGFSSFEFWVFFVIGAILCSITAGVIFSRGFKTVKISVIRGVCAVAISIFLCVCLIFCSGYAEKYIPKAEDIVSISVGNSSEAVFYDNFDIILDIHKAALKYEIEGAEKSDLEDDEKIDEKGYYTLANSITGIRFEYTLKSGRKVTRRYFNLYGTEYEELFIRYMLSEEYLARFSRVDSSKEGVNVYYTSGSGDQKGLSTAILKSQAAELMATYAEELRAAEKEAFYEPCDLIELYGVSQNYYNTVLTIPTSFTKTRAIIEGYTFAE